MNLNDKSKEELIIDLQQLQQSYDSLKQTLNMNYIISKQVEKALLESEERYQLLFDKAPLGYQSLDFDGFFIEVNQQWLDTLGYQREEVIGKWFGDFLTPAYQDGFRQRFPIFKAQGHIHSEFEMQHKNGSVLFIAFEGKIGYDLNGEFKQTHCILQNITERKKKDEEIKKTGLYYQALIEKAPDGIALIDTDGKFKYISPAAKKMFGYMLSDEVNGNPSEFTHPDDLQMVLSELGKIFADPTYIPTLEYRFIDKQGQLHWVETTFSNLLANPNVESIVLNFRDITERKLSEALFKDIVEKNPMSIQILDMEGFKIQENTAHTKLFGVEPPSGYSVLKDTQLLALGFDEYFDRIKKGEVVYFPDSYYNVHDVDSSFPDSPVWVKALGFTINDNNGKPEKIVLMHENITERKNAEALLNDIIENNPMSIQIVDKEGHTLRGNPAFIQLFGSVPPPEYSIFEDLKTKSPEMENIISSVMDGEIVHLPDIYFNAHDTVTEAPDIPLWIRALIFPLKNSIGKPEHFVFMHENITVSKIAEQELIKAKEKAEESEEKYRLLFDNANEAIYIVQNEKLVFTNPTCELITGISKDSLIGFSISDFVDENDKENLSKHHLELINGIAQNQNSFFTIINQKGEKRHLSVNSVLINWNGLPATLNFGTDITERKQTEEEFKASEERFRLLIELAPDAFLQGDKNGNLIGVNNKAIEMFGYLKEELLSMNIKDLFPKEVLEAKPLNYELLKTGIGLKTERQIRKKNNENIFVEMNSKGMPDGTYQSFIRDITERKQAAEALRESEERYKALHNASFGGIAIHDKGIIMECNQGLSEITGYTYAELIGMDGLLLIASKTRDLVLNNILSGYEKSYEALGERKNGEIYPLRLQARNVPYKGKIVRTVEFRDITEQKNTEQELIKAKEKAEESERLKTAFLANMSHEIRTPMNGILGFADLLKEPDLTSEQQQNYIRIIERSGARMLNIINDIIDISKIEAGLINVDLKESNINDQIDYIYTFFKPEVVAKGLQLLLINTLPAKESIIITDREKVFAILTNLVKNAIKYTIKGKIEIAYTHVEIPNSDSEKEKLYLQFFVKDTGIGIPKERQQAIFERFIQADIADSNAMEGAGLGLAITKAYVEMLGGKIWVDSEEGVGSTFYFTLPYKIKQQEKNEVENMLSSEIESTIFDPLVSGLKILIAEDDDISEIFISTIIKSISKEIMKTRNGLETVEICRNNLDIDLILLDLKMPEMNGYEACRQIRQFNKDVIIIAQTAFGLSGDREKAIEAGCNDYITKPINKDKLKEMINSYFKND